MILRPHTPSWLRVLSRLVPDGARRGWIDEWVAELNHATSQRAGGMRVTAAAIEDAIRLAVRSALGALTTPAGWIWELRLAARRLIRDPGFAVIAILTVALGVCANAAVFAVLDAYVLRPLPLPDSERVVAVMRQRQGDTNFVSAADYLDWQASASSFDFLAAAQVGGANLEDQGAPARVRRAAVRPEIFDVLGLGPVIGRTIGTADTGAPSEVVLLSWQLWMTRFGGRDVLGSTVAVDGRPHRIIGVMPASANVPPLSPDIWTPLIFDADVGQSRGRMNLYVFGRLKEGVSLEASAMEVRSIASRLEVDYPRTNTGWSARVDSLHAFIVGANGNLIWKLFAGVLLVLAIAGLNLANLLDTRGVARRTELAVRLALGASRAAVVRSLLAEALAIGLGAAVIGLAGAWLSLGTVRALMPPHLTAIGDIALDTRLVLFGVVASLLVALAGGLPTALRLTAHPHAGLGDPGSLRVRADTHRLRRGLAAAQFAVAGTLLFASLLVGRSVMRLYGVEMGLDYNGVTAFSLTFPASRFDSPARLRQAVDDVLDGLRARGYAAAGAVSHLPLTGAALRSSLWIEGREEPPDIAGPQAAIKVVTRSYFEVVRIPVVAGRGFNEADREGAEPVVLVNATAARAFWPQQEAVGKWVAYTTDIQGRPERRRVVGVIGDVRYAGPAEPSTAEVYEPHLQTTATWAWFGRSMSFVVRDDAGRRPDVEAVADVVGQIDSTIPVAALGPLAARLDRTLSTPRFNAALFGAFGGLALILAALGMYGVLAFAVRLRRREFGIRLALGQTGAGLLRSVLADGLWIAGVGGAMGLAASLALARVMTSFVWGISTTDPSTFVLALSVLALMTLAGAIWPALRAARIDPVRALRSE